MSYEQATATALLSTSCLCCGRPLLDAASVTAGIGPVCREKYGYGQIGEEIRIPANKLIHEAAMESTENSRREEIAVELEEMGADVLAAKIRDRFMKPAAKIWTETVVFGKGQWAKEFQAQVIKTRWCPDFNKEFKARVDWRDRTVAKTAKGKFAGWAFKPSARQIVWEVLQDTLGGETLLTAEKGIVIIPPRPSAE